MRNQKDYIEDLTEIRSMMERSSKFLSLSGWAGIMAGIYALAGAWVAGSIYKFNPEKIEAGKLQTNMSAVVILSILVLILAISTAVYLSYKKAAGKGEKLWNASSRRLLTNLFVPLFAGGILIIVLLSKGFIGLIAPLSLLFYGLALYNAGKFTYDEVKILGLIQMALGLAGAYFVEYGLLLWAVGFGAVHIIYGIYMHFRYDR